MDIYEQILQNKENIMNSNYQNGRFTNNYNINNNYIIPKKINNNRFINQYKKIRNFKKENR